MWDSKRSRGFRECVLAVKVITGLLCFAGFVINSIVIFEMFSRHETVITTSHFEHGDKTYRVPAIVFCSEIPYKDPEKSMLTLQDYENNTIDPRRYIVKTLITNREGVRLDHYQYQTF